MPQPNPLARDQIYFKRQLASKFWREAQKPGIAPETKRGLLEQVRQLEDEIDKLNRSGDHMDNPLRGLPLGWADWKAFEKRYARTFIQWAEPAPRDPGEVRYAIMLSDDRPGAHVIWARVYPNLDIHFQRSQGGFYDVPEEGKKAIPWAIEAAMEHKNKTMRANPSDWWGPGERWLEQEALKEYRVQKAAHIKRGRSPNTFRYTPPDWQRDAVDALGKNDEERFKAIKLARIGYPPLRSNPSDSTTALFALGALALAGGLVWWVSRPGEAKAAELPPAPAKKCASLTSLEKFAKDRGYKLYVPPDATTTPMVQWPAPKPEYAGNPSARSYSLVDCAFAKWDGTKWVVDAATSAEFATWVKTSTVTGPPHPVSMFVPA